MNGFERRRGMKLVREGGGGDNKSSGGAELLDSEVRW